MTTDLKEECRGKQLVKTLAQAAFVAALGAAATEQAAATPIGDPYYAYYFYETRELNPTPNDFTFPRSLAQSGDQHGGTLLKTHQLGGSFLGQIAQGAVAGYNDGQTFWSESISPLRGGAARNVVGVESQIYVVQSYRKDTVDASLRFSFSNGTLQLVNFGSGRGDGFDIYSYVQFSAFVVNHATSLQTWTEDQRAWLYQDFGSFGNQQDNRWAFTSTQEHGPLSSGMAPWQWSCAACGGPDHGFVDAALVAPYSGDVSLANIALGEEFTVAFYLTTVAVDEAQGETSAFAYVRDPTSSGGSGVAFSFDGLTPTDEPIVAAVPEPETYALMGLGMVMLVAWRRRRPRLHLLGAAFSEFQPSPAPAV